MTLSEYIYNINQRYKLGNATEHTFRADLQNLLESMVPEIRATNEPKRQKCGAPDYIITKKNIPVGFIEAKDIGDGDLQGLKKSGNKEQFDRYKESLDNIIFTDYLSFFLYRNGTLVSQIAIGRPDGNKIVPLPENFEPFALLIKDFCTHIGQTIKSSRKLAEMMAGKARLLANIIENALIADQNESTDNVQETANNTLRDQLTAFKNILIHDITPKEFADVYAQTIAYGMFAARLHDNSLNDFSRQEAAELIPKSNPFLRKLFQYIAGYDLDDRIKWIVDSLVEIFRATNIQELLKDFGKATKMEDPIIHFYETFLSAYDPNLRKARGVWYTPQPIVNFIVRAVDEILKTEFDLPQGLADTSKTRIKVNVQGKMQEQEVHKVQILDPATGTGTFLAEVIKLIYKNFEGQQGIWNQYVEKHLLPRLNGFELLMASYAMAHLKLDLLLAETGYTHNSNQRFRVYLTNSLEEHHHDTGTLFANWLSQEANEANHIKRDTPVVCVIGNPPYSGESANKGEWIMKLMEDYKKEPGGKEKLKERNPKAINDDYVKFLRYGQHFIEKNGSGVLAFINPHGFLDNLTYRGMRWNLLKTYDKIYTIDLHGNAKKKETAPDGSADINVFDIEQGVSINFFVKTGKKKTTELAKVFHYDLFGKREFKYDFLTENNLKTVAYKEVKIVAPNYFFIEMNFKGQSNYNKGIAINELFPISTSGIKTHSDGTLVNFSKFENSNQFYNYRPFDVRYIEYDLSKVQRHRFSVMKHMLKDNLTILTCRQLSTFDFQHIFISKYLVDMCTVSLQTKETTYAFTLYLYPETNGQQTIGQTSERTPNLNTDLVKKIAEQLGLNFTNEKEITENTFAPIDILDYIYAVLHSPTYREKYKEFLKIDFPRVPYPKDKETFGQLVALGSELRQIHLLESPVVEKRITTYPQAGSNQVDKVQFIITQNTDIVSSQIETCSPPSEGLGEVTKPGYNTANPDTYRFIKEIRNELKNSPTPAEQIMWDELRNKKTGHKIRRQHIIGDFIPDFVCLRKRTIIEIDGKIHLQQKEYDIYRTFRLNQLGYDVVRFTNEEVIENPQLVTLKVKEILDAKPDYERGDDTDDRSEISVSNMTPPNLPKGEEPLGLTAYGRVFINDVQYFDGVPEIAWHFYIGGYQPAQKWLKDRKGRALSFEDILHYQKIVVALTETNKIMGEVDRIDI